MITMDLEVANTGDLWDIAFNDSTVDVGPGFDRTLTVFEDDGTTPKARVLILADGLSRIKMSPTP